MWTGPGSRKRERPGDGSRGTGREKRADGGGGRSPTSEGPVVVSSGVVDQHETSVVNTERL